jgi:hypothetical protein
MSWTVYSTCRIANSITQLAPDPEDIMDCATHWSFAAIKHITSSHSEDGSAVHLKLDEVGNNWDPMELPITNRGKSLVMQDAILHKIELDPARLEFQC